MIRSVLYAFYLNMLRKDVRIGIGSALNPLTYLEGENVLGRMVSFKNSRLGIASYIGNNSHLSHVKIGKYCSIGENVKVITGTHPTDQNISTHPAFYSKNNVVGISYVDKKCFEENNYVEDNYNVCIGNDVWIGSDVKILQGVKINNGAIVGCGAVVTKDVPPYAIVGGVPAKIIRYRFSEEKILDLQQIQWWEWSQEKLKNKAELFCCPERFNYRHLDI